MSNNHPRIVIDLRKVQYATLEYFNQYGDMRKLKPKQPTVRGEVLVGLAYHHPLYPDETAVERARRLHMLDQWTPRVRFQFAANHSVCYKGGRAMELWKAWNAYIFKPTRKG